VRSRLVRLSLLATLLIVAALPLNGQSQQGADADVPRDLRPLLARPQSEMRLVTQWYTLDRGLLDGNYAGGTRGGMRGRGAPADSAPARTSVPPSVARIARLKRFDTDWLAALSELDAGRLSPDARLELQALKTMIGGNLTELEADTVVLATTSPAVPFAPRLVALIEARIKVKDIDAQKAAGELTLATKEIAAIRLRLARGLDNHPDGLRIDKGTALRAAATVDELRGLTSEWFTFYNGYDPLFTWWMGLPHKRANAALDEFSTFLKTTIAPADVQTHAQAPAVTAIAAAPPPPYRSVPDLRAILALPQDEMIPVVQRFRGPQAGGRRGGAAPAARPVSYYRAWLAALKTLDFDTLTRNAQVDYLFIKRSSEREIARAGLNLEANPPRKTDGSGIPGAARGRDGLVFDLSEEMIPYSPEQLIALANKEFAWCEEEMKKASRQVGFGDDWKKAVEKVKDTYVPPGGQPAMIRDLLDEAVAWLREKDALTVPAVGAESLHMIMMTPERQLVNPFFTGGSQMSVSYPTDTMEHDQRIQSMRGNNPGFSHATAGHEMIPGHNLVGYMGQRHAGYRASFGSSTPFFGEGWPLYWELTFYDRGFHATPEQKVGALFWRMHRCARIIFSLNFHMGIWSPQESIDFLVDKVGHERENATAEVRRSFATTYGPLYQAAYLLGGLQLRGLRRELVDTGLLTEKAFHDEILRQGSMPVALIRLAVGKQKLTRDMNIDWEFYGSTLDR
jgi:uncharacterized protein (DUF885 family)